MTSATNAGRPALIVLAKRPEPGRVKTRLTPPFTPEEAAELAAAALTDTLRVVSATPTRGRVLAFDGDPRGWLPQGWRHVRQPAGGLDRRIAHAFRATGVGPAVLVGMDTPQLTRSHLESFDHTRYDAAVGRAGDGGYWGIGFRDASVAERALPGVPMSTDHTCDDQLARLHELGLTVQELDEVDDVDTAADARRIARLAPDTAFAAALRAVEVGVSA